MEPIGADYFLPLPRVQSGMEAQVRTADESGAQAHQGLLPASAGRYQPCQAGAVGPMTACHHAEWTAVRCSASVGIARCDACNASTVFRMPHTWPKRGDCVHVPQGAIVRKVRFP